MVCCLFLQLLCLVAFFEIVVVFFGRMLVIVITNLYLVQYSQEF